MKTQSKYMYPGPNKRGTRRYLPTGRVNVYVEKFILMYDRNKNDDARRRKVDRYFHAQYSQWQGDSPMKNKSVSQVT